MFLYDSLDDLELWRNWIQNSPNLLSSTTVTYETPGRHPDSLFLWAVVFRKVEAVRLFVEEGANRNKRSSKLRHPPLHECYYSRPSEVRSNGRSLCVNQCTTQIVELLLMHGTNLNSKDRSGLTALRWAARFGDADSLRLLLEAGADVTIRGKNGWTPLLYAKLRRKDSNITNVAILLEPKWGIKPDSRCSFGRNALAREVLNDSPKVAHMLFERGVRVVDDQNAKTRKDAAVNLLPFLFAGKKGNVELTYILLQQVVAARAQPFAWLGYMAKKELPNWNPFHNLAQQIRYYAPWNQYKE